MGSDRSSWAASDVLRAASDDSSISPFRLGDQDAFPALPADLAFRRENASDRDVISLGRTVHKDLTCPCVFGWRIGSAATREARILLSDGAALLLFRNTRTTHLTTPLLPLVVKQRKHYLKNLKTIFPAPDHSLHHSRDDIGKFSSAPTSPPAKPQTAQWLDRYIPSKSDETDKFSRNK
jgi:hypothetical protein